MSSKPVGIVMSPPRDTDSVTVASRYQERLLVIAAAPPTSRLPGVHQMSPGQMDTWSIAQLLWPRLDSETRKAVRATCRTGRFLHGYLSDSLAIKPREKAPSPKAMGRTLVQLTKTCSKLTSLRIHLDRESKEGKLQTLVALRVCGTPLLTSLTLEGELPFTPGIASAIATHCPALAHLALRYLSSDNDESCFSHSENGRWVRQGELLGQLLTRVGPRLKDLELVNMAVWFAPAYEAVASCTALQSLHLRVSEYLLVAVPVQEGLLSSIGQLTQLRSLTLEYECYCYPHEHVVPAHDRSSLRHLSSLTRLTSLDLNLNHYETLNDCWWIVIVPSYAHWHHLWSEQRAALAKALRCMPQLASFTSRTLHMCASDFAPLPSSLTRVALGGLLSQGRTPTAQPQPQPAAASACCHQPGNRHKQQEKQQGQGVQLSLHKMASVRTLASVRQHWPALRSIQFNKTNAGHGGGLVDLFFGPLDVVPGTDVLRPDTPDAVRRAVEAVLYGSGVPGGTGVAAAGPRAAGSGGAEGVGSGACRRRIQALGVRADLGLALARPPQGEVQGEGAGQEQEQEQGHAAWIRELAPLARAGQVVDFKGFRFEARDALAIVDTFPGAKVMVLQDSHIPIGCLPYLGQLRGLEEVTVNLARCADANQSTLEAALLRLCCTAPALQRVNMWNQVPRLGAVLERVRQALGSSGRRAVQLKCCGERCWIP